MQEGAVHLNSDPCQTYTLQTQQLDTHLGASLDDDWGLDTLVRVGETWLPRMLEVSGCGGSGSSTAQAGATAAGGPAAATAAATDVPLLKLFEFLCASMCLYVIDEAPPAARPAGLWAAERRDGGGKEDDAAAAPPTTVWWSVDAPPTEPPDDVPPLMRRALALLLTALRMRAPAAWKSVQLAVVMLWNAAAQSPAVERHQARAGAAPLLLALARGGAWPAALRDMAAGQLQHLMEAHGNLAQLGAEHRAALAAEAAAAAAAAAGGAAAAAAAATGNEDERRRAAALAAAAGEHPGLAPFMAAMVRLIETGHPLLELRGARGIARTCFSAPRGAPRRAALLRAAKATAAAAGAVGALVALLGRAAPAYLAALRGGRAPRQATPRGGRGSAAAEGSGGGGGGGEEDSSMYERDMGTCEVRELQMVDVPRGGWRITPTHSLSSSHPLTPVHCPTHSSSPCQAALELLLATLSALLNLTTLPANQPAVARRGLEALLGANSALYAAIMALVRPGRLGPEGVLLDVLLLPST